MKDVEIVTWAEVGAKIRQVNPSLYNIIDEFSPGHNYPLIHVSYPFGANIAQEGRLYAPSNNDLVISTLTDKLPKQMLQNIIPVMMSLNRTSEIYLESPMRIMPYKMILPGQLFSYPDYVIGEKQMEPRLPWRITAGVRSIFMLPKVTESIGHKRLRMEFKASFHPPKTLWEHYQIFRQIAAHGGDAHRWQSNVIIFTAPWLKLISNYLQKRIYCQNSYLYQQRLLIMHWAFLVSSIAGSVKLRPYLIDTVNHLFSIGTGIVPGFQAVGRSELPGPIDLFERAYIEVYGLRDYLPIIMCPNLYTSASFKAPSYYSLALPTVLESYPSAKTSPNIIHDLKDVKYLQELFQRRINQAVNFEYFHTTADKRNNIYLTQSIPKKDPFILKTFEKYKSRKFPAASPFVRGCIRANILV